MGGYPPGFVLVLASQLITTFQAIVLGIIQGVTELFPISSLGHTVLLPNLFGWNNIVAWQSEPSSPWLAFLVMLHVGSAIGLLIYFWRDWVEIVRAFFRTLARRRIETPTEKLAWLIIVTTIPTGILGLVLEHPVRVALAKPTAAAVFPQEMFRVPKAYAESRFNLVRYTRFDRGGHFAALEEPDLLVDDIKTFFEELPANA